MSESQSVVVAMSGGVDSSAAALMLVEKGYRVVGVAMQVWDYRRDSSLGAQKTCCAPKDFDDARKVAEIGKFPFYVFDFEDSFREKVINPFVHAYLNGYTPNPCLDCNRKVKFQELRVRAKALGMSTVATGHYAEIREKEEGLFGLYAGEDADKDQSYFLYSMTQKDLASTLFPVGGLKKSEVRAYLEKRGLEIAEKKESQDICFVATSAGDFVAREAKLGEVEGEIVNSQGQVLGRHKGVHHFTVGQRKGLRLSNPNPLYVLDVNAESQRVVVGEESELETEEFFVRDVNWVSGEPPEQSQRVLAKLRYRHQGVLCDVVPLSGVEDSPEGNKVLARFVDSWTAVSPGQAAVFYSTTDSGGSREVLGGGIIERRKSH